MAASGLVTYPGWMNAVFWISFGAWMAMEIWVWLRERRGRTSGQSRDRGSLWWVVAWVWAGIYAAFGFRHSGMGHIAGHRLGWYAAGIAGMWLGVGLRLWAVLTLGRFFRTWVVIQDEHRMITHGPYRWVRNPSYSGATLTMLGMGLAMLNWYSTAALLAGILIAYARRIAVEQRALTAHFGPAYQDYVRRTWALIPFLW